MTAPHAVLLATQNALFKSAAEENLFGIDKALASGGLVDGLNESGLSALGVAASLGKLKSIRALLAAGADANAGLGFGSRPLPSAAKMGHAHCIAPLAAAGANVREKIPRRAGVQHDPGGMVSAAAFDGHAKVIEELVKAGADPDEEYHGSTALGVAVCLGELKAALMLLKMGADASVVDSESGKTVAMHAANVGLAAIIEPLALHGCDLAKVGLRGETAMSISVESSYEDCVQIIGAILARKERDAIGDALPKPGLGQTPKRI